MHFPKSGYKNVGGAWIHPEATIAEGVVVDPGAVVGAQVTVGRGSWIGSGAVIYGPTTVGEENAIHPTSVLGGAPQDLGYQGEPTRLEIGSHNVFRELVTINRASTKGERVTRIGNRNLFMAGSHIGHDCVVGDDCVFANDVLIAGHCTIGSNVTLAGAVAIVQFSTVGRFAFMGGLSGSHTDIEPFISHDGMPSRPHAVNVVGLRRGKVAQAAINKLKEAFRVIFTDVSVKGGDDLSEAEAELARRDALCPEVVELLAFMRRSREGRFGRQSQGARPVAKLIPEGEAGKTS